MTDTKAPSFEERVFVMRKFLASIGEEEAARFVSHTDEAVDGLSINHTAFVEEYKKLLDTIAQLRAENAEMREALESMVGRFGGSSKHIFDTEAINKARAVLAKYPEVKK